MSVERHFGFEAQCIASAQAARKYAKILPRVEYFTPDASAGGKVSRDIDLEAILTRVAGARDQGVGNAADRPMGEPVIFDRGKIDIREFLQNLYSLRALYRELCVVVADVISVAAKADDVLFYPAIVFFSRSRVNHQQIIVFAEFVNDYVIDESALRIEQRRIVCLPYLQL